MSVLIVDSDLEFLERASATMQTLSGELGLTIHTAKNGLEGLKKAKDLFTPEGSGLIFLAVSMPCGSGIQVAPLIRVFARKVTIVLLSKVVLPRPESFQADGVIVINDDLAMVDYRLLGYAYSVFQNTGILPVSSSLN